MQLIHGILLVIVLALTAISVPRADIVGAGGVTLAIAAATIAASHALLNVISGTNSLPCQIYLIWFAVVSIVCIAETVKEWKSPAAWHTEKRS